MKKKNEAALENFRAVEFMRQARSELSDKYFHDKEAYFKTLDAAAKAFKARQDSLHRQPFLDAKDEHAKSLIEKYGPPKFPNRK